MARRGLFLVPSRAKTSFTLIHVADLTHAVRLVLESPQSLGETMFVGHRHPHTGAEVLSAIAEVVGRPFRPLHVPGALFAAAARFGDLSWKLGVRPLIDSGRLAELRGRGFVCSVDRVRDVVGFEAAIDLRQGMAQTGQWYVDNDWI